MRQDLADYRKAIANRQFPPPYPFLEPVSVESHMWEATLQTGALDLFDVPTVYAMSAFYNELNEGFAALDQLRDLSERMIVPNLSAGASHWYDLDKGEVRPQYAWWFSQQERLARIAGQITTMGDSLVVRLKNAETQR